MNFSLCANMSGFCSDSHILFVCVCVCVCVWGGGGSERVCMHVYAECLCVCILSQMSLFYAFSGCQYRL